MAKTRFEIALRAVCVNWLWRESCTNELRAFTTPATLKLAHSQEWLTIICGRKRNSFPSHLKYLSNASSNICLFCRAPATTQPAYIDYNLQNLF